MVRPGPAQSITRVAWLWSVLTPGVNVIPVWPDNRALMRLTAETSRASEKLLVATWKALVSRSRPAAHCNDAGTGMRLCVRAFGEIVCCALTVIFDIRQANSSINWQVFMIHS